MSPSNEPQRLSLVDLSDEEIEHQLLRSIQRYPSVDSKGRVLFDANGNNPISEVERAEMAARLEQKFAEIFDILRIDRNDPNSMDTPLRLSRMWINELLVGRFTAPPKMTVFPNRKNVDELVISKNIKVMSVCSHHWQPITGTCSIGYVPRHKVIGLSKFTRIVEWFSRRGQIQEELGEQIADFLIEMLDPIALGVVISSKHYCMIARGVEAADSSVMITSVMRGDLSANQALRNEFLRLIGEQ